MCQVELNMAVSRTSQRPGKSEGQVPSLRRSSVQAVHRRRYLGHADSSRRPPDAGRFGGSRTTNHLLSGGATSITSRPTSDVRCS